ncbi:MAG: SET domain-containing protein-lysine N-methyltransferase [Planctomycetota bacterium]
MLHPATELRTIDPAIGAGVFATQDLPRGTIVWIRDALDRAFSPQQLAAFSGPMRDSLLKYTYVDGSGYSIFCWDLSKYVNHHCEANLLSTPFELELAVRDIAAGEQLTDDYGSFNIAQPLTCLCGSPRCRGTIQRDDPQRLAPEWDAKVRAAFPDLLRVEQPLWSLVVDPERLERAARDPEAIPSVLVNYVDPELRGRRYGGDR